MPVDMVAIAGRLDCSPELLFGRLYYHFDRLHGYDKDDGKVRVAFFAPNVDGKRHVINFPLLESVLAGKTEELRKQRVTQWTAIAALALSVGKILWDVAASMQR